MVLQSLLSEKKEALAKKWFELVAQSYPSQTAEFLKNNKGQFSNPVGYSLRHGLGALLDEMAGDMSQERLRDALDSIIRIRAVQDFTPSEAVSFIFPIKDIVFQELGNQIETKELQAFTKSIDQIALIAFDVYMGCREDLFEVRVREVEKRNFRLLQVANQLFELKGDETLSELHEGANTEKGKR
jgi:hypothetical protein